MKYFHRTLLAAGGSFLITEGRDQISAGTAIGNVPENFKLQAVIVFFRHGARTPNNVVFKSSSEPTHYWEPHLFRSFSNLRCSSLPFRLVDLHGEPLSDKVMMKSEKTLPGGMRIGEETRLGCQQMFNLGRHLRMRYIEDQALLSSSVNQNDIYCRSTYASRCIASMSSVLAGLIQTDVSQTNFIPQIHVANREEETLTINKKFCNVLKQIFDRGRQKLVENADIESITTSLLDILKVPQLKSITQEGCGSCSLHHANDDFTSHHYHGFVINKQIEKKLDTLSRLSATEFIYELFGGPVPENLSVLRYNIGALLDMIVNVLGQIELGEHSHKMYLHATHDFILIPLLVALNSFDYKIPSYGADLTFEVYRDSLSGELWIKVLYCGQPLLPVTFAHKKDYPHLLSFVEIKDHLKKYSVPLTEYKKLCQSQFSDNILYK